MAGKTLLLIINKRFLLILLVSLLISAALSNYTASVLARKAYYPLTGKKIVIDPGHGGVDSGANNSAGFKEKEINLQVALRLQKLLSLAGAEVLMTRNSDTDVTERGDASLKRYRRDMDGRRRVMNDSGADVFVSLHINSCAGAKRTRGAFVFYKHKSEESKLLAECLQGQLNGMVARYKKSGELAERDPRRGDYFLLNNADIPVALIEMGFMTHYEESRLLYEEDYQEELAKAIADGLRDYFLCLAVQTSA